MVSQTSIIHIPVFPDPVRISRIIEQIPHSFFLDSSDHSHPQSRYSYVGMNPTEVLCGDDDPWPKLEEIYQGWGTACHVPTDPFFTGGLVGYLAYENHQYIDPYNQHLLMSQGDGQRRTGSVPNYWFARCDDVLVMDHKNKKCFVASWCLSEKELEKKAEAWMGFFKQEKEVDLNTLLQRVDEEVSKIDYEKYKQKILKIKNYLESGDVYQINLTERFEAAYQGPSSVLYNHLRKHSPVPYGAFLNAGDFQILSASPESFIEIHGQRIQTRPIKGTRKRATQCDEDQRLSQELEGSEKDRAELLMIVDLERNDLGKICEFGSVKVDSLREVESFAQVHHLVSTISGLLNKEVSPIEAIKEMFPGGSITGAPKKRAIEIIKELEEKPRSVYTGALGFVGARGLTQFNMPIRTLTKVGNKVYFNAGGGIVIDSDPRTEYEEMMVKASGMIKALCAVRGE